MTDSTNSLLQNFEDFAWLQRSLLTQDEVPGLQGIIFPPLPAKPYVFQSNTQAKMIKQLGLLGLSTNWQTYSKALEKYLQQVASHTMLSKNPALKCSSLTFPFEVGALFCIHPYFGLDRSLWAYPNHPYFNRNSWILCGTFSSFLKKNYENVAENNLNSLGSMLDLDSRYQEAEKEMLFRRTCKLVELENIGKNLEKAKSVKKATVSGLLKKKSASSILNACFGFLSIQFCEIFLLCGLTNDHLCVYIELI
uniref:PX domain-containing protein n=1 Tax=Scleropages formosus TaxID=113540 RepID=A0A8C9SD71_SCLFO